jgi:hypothetical protein
MNEAVRGRIAAERNDGRSWQVIARRLNRDGVPTSSGHGEWHAATCRRAVEPYRSQDDRYMSRLRRR